MTFGGKLMTDSVVYFIRRHSDDAIKIGVTKNMKSRLNNLKLEHGDLSLIGTIKGGVVREKLLHWIFNGQRLDGEFFKPDQELLSMIDEYAEKPDYEKTKQTLELDKHLIEALRDIAREHGLTVERGALAGTGSIKKLNEAIARGDLAVLSIGKTASN